MLSHFSRVWLFVTLWTIACQAPLSTGFSRQEYYKINKLNTRKINDPIKKWAKELNRHFSPKKTYRWLTNTWKDAQHHSLSEKCKSKPQWGTISHRSEWLPLQNLQAINDGECGEKGTPLTLLVGVQTSTAVMENSVEIPLKTGNRTALWSSSLLGIHSEETRRERDTCTPVFIAALFIIARTWKQPGCPLADKWIRNLWYINAMEYYSAMKKNAFKSVPWDG